MYGRFVHVFMSFHPIPSLLDPFLSFIPLERNIQAGLREDTNCEVNQAWGGNWNRFSTRVSRCLPGKFWIFCNLMFSVQNSLRKIGTMWVERGHFPLVLMAPPPCVDMHVNPPLPVPSAGNLSAFCVGLWASRVWRIGGFYALSSGPAQSPLPAWRYCTRVRGVDLGKLVILKTFLMRDWDKYIETGMVTHSG